MATLYHIRISTKSDPTHDEVKLGLGRQSVLSDFLIPLHEGRSVLINGRRIEAADISRALVSMSDRSIDDLRREIHAQDAASPVIFIGGLSDEWRIADRSEDCSDELHAEAETLAARGEPS